MENEVHPRKLELNLHSSSLENNSLEKELKKNLGLMRIEENDRPIKEDTKIIQKKLTAIDVR